MGKHLLILLLFVGSFYSKAESYPPTFRAVVEQVGDGPFLISQSAVDSVGNTFWAGGYWGSTASIGTLTLTNTHPRSFKGCLFKLGPNLEERWAKGGSGLGEQGITGLAVDAQGNCYLAYHCWGNSFTFGNVTYTSASNQFTVVFKYSSDGNRIWAHQADGIMNDGWAKTLTVDSNRNVFFGGAFEDKRSFVRKLNSSGNTFWNRTGDQIETGFSFSLKTDSAGNCFMLSSFTKATATFGDAVIQNRGRQNYVLVKYDSAGDVSWVRRGGGNGPSEDYGIDLAVDQNGDVYVWSVVGSTNFLFGTNDIALTPRNWVLAKYSANSQPLWAKSFPVATIFEIGGVSLDENGDLLLSASSSSGEPYEGFLAKCTSDGELVWTKKARTDPESESSGGSMLWVTRLISNGQNNLYVAGFLNQPGLGGVFLDSFSVTRAFLSKLAFDPELSSSLSGDWLTLSWPTNEAGFFLEASEYVDGTNQWATVTNSVVLHNGQYAVTNAVSGTNRFYRLHKTLP